MPDTLRFLTVTLDAMAYGGIYDQLGGGFHRYSTERTWSLPHFEKMLYDNAQLLSIYAQAWELTGRAQYRRIAMGVRGYLRTQMMSRNGGFYTAQDAAVEGREGASYVWTRRQIDELLGKDATAFFETYALTALRDRRRRRSTPMTFPVCCVCGCKEARRSAKHVSPRSSLRGASCWPHATCARNRRSTRRFFPG